MKPIRAIIVDDEAAARDVLQNLVLRAKVDVEIIAQCRDLEEAVVTIKKQKPDVVFLDVQMPNYAGYEIASFFDTIDFEIVFVTAYDQYAIKAFELSAVDYLVKPISRPRLQEALDKLTARVEQKDHAERFHVLQESMREKELGKIVISELGNKRVIALADIIAIEGNGAYSSIHLQGEEPLLVSKNLKHFESALPGEGPFFRAHKSWIIATNHIIGFSKGQGEVELKKKVIARVSRHRMQELDDLVNKGSGMSKA